MHRLIRESRDLLVRIPTAGAPESVNASVAAGICLFESVHRRNRGRRWYLFGVATPTLKRLGRYTIDSTLGQGAMGVVYGATDSMLHRKVALKTILKSALDPETARQYSLRFMREAQAVARLNHPNIVQVHDFGEEGDVAYIVMEFIRGRDLQKYFDAGHRFELKETVCLVSNYKCNTRSILNRSVAIGHYDSHLGLVEREEIQPRSGW